MTGSTNAVVGIGGEALSFSVVGGTTQPAGKENLIWVNTATSITDWMFSATAPTVRSDGTALSGGEVWFRTGESSSSFNAIKENGIWVYPNACKQYISGAWVGKNVERYKDGAWAALCNGLVLYDTGTAFFGFEAIKTGAMLTTGVYDLSPFTTYNVTWTSFSGSAFGLYIFNSANASVGGFTDANASYRKVTHVLTADQKANPYKLGILLDGSELIITKIWLE